MRGNDEEFKAELLLRVKKYKEHRQKQCRNALKAASLAVMVCVLVVSSRWGNLAIEDWGSPSNEIGTDQSVTGNETLGEEGTVGENETDRENTTNSQTSEDSVIKESENWTEDTIITENECEGIGPGEEIAGSPAESNGLSGISIRKENNGVQFEEAGKPSQETKYYRDQVLANQMLDFLVEKIAEAEENTVYSHGGATSPDAQLSGKTCRIVIRYKDGRAIAYQVAEGTGESYIKGGRLILDKESWTQLLGMTDN